MRTTAILTILLALVLAACGGPKLRKPAKVKPKQMHRNCDVVESSPISAEQAICIARLAGIHVDDDTHSIRAGKAPSGLATWIIDETCGAANPECIGIVVSQADGMILDTRYLYVIKADDSAQR